MIEALMTIMRGVGWTGPVTAPTGIDQSLWHRVWAKVRVPDDLNACWLWTGAQSHKRRGKRGVIQVGGRGTRVVLVCRLICEWFQGAAPSSDHEAGHTCPTGEKALCCNPRHLVWQTREENERWKATYE